MNIDAFFWSLEKVETEPISLLELEKESPQPVACLN